MILLILSIIFPTTASRHSSCVAHSKHIAYDRPLHRLDIHTHYKHFILHNIDINSFTDVYKYMDAILNCLVDWGYWGMLISAFLAGSFFPFSSEAVMVGLQAAGLEPLPLVI